MVHSLHANRDTSKWTGGFRYNYGLFRYHQWGEHTVFWGLTKNVSEVWHLQKRCSHLPFTLQSSMEWNFSVCWRFTQWKRNDWKQMALKTLNVSNSAISRIASTPVFSIIRIHLLLLPLARRRKHKTKTKPSDIKKYCEAWLNHLDRISGDKEEKVTSTVLWANCHLRFTPRKT